MDELGAGGAGDEGVPNRQYLPSLAITKAPLSEGPLAAVKPITKDGHTLSKTPFSRAYVNAEYQGRPLMCMLDTGCDRSVIGRQVIDRHQLQPKQFSLLAAGRNPLKVDGETVIQFSIDGHPMEAEVSVSLALDELLLGCDWLTNRRGSGTSPLELFVWEMSSFGLG